MAQAHGNDAMPGHSLEKLMQVRSWHPSVIAMRMDQSLMAGCASLGPAYAPTGLTTSLHIPIMSSDR